MTTRDRQRAVGSLFCFGLAGLDITPRLERYLQEWGLGGVLLLGGTLERPAEIWRFTRALRRLAPATPLLIAVDQEGGRVSRLKGRFTHFPPAAAMERVEVAREVGGAVGRELAAVGINVDFAPVLDVHSNPANPVIGDRAFGTDPGGVVRLAMAFAQGLEAEGVLPCGKHFPGHGDTVADSHHELPLVTHDLGRLRQVEIAPFREAAAQGLAMLMTAHVLYPALDPAWPATLSSRVLTDLARRELGFAGLLVSDDLTMQGITSRFTVPEAACRFLQVGGDWVLVACEEGALEAVLEAVLRAAETGRIPAERLAEVAERLTRLRAKAATCPMAGRAEEAEGIVGQERHRLLAEKIRSAGR
ncbi:MAG: beta-N-acetylhexosaminidase [Candidatus Methylomirabilales bacterium]